jgi:hypothetical protein
LVGYTARSPAVGLVPVYHFYKSNADHLVTIHYWQGKANGYELVEQMGYAAP